MTQPDLFTRQPPFDGPDLAPEDHQRLGDQLQRVKQFMSAGNWWTLQVISEVTRTPEASVSARLRDLRKPKFGGHTIERRNLGRGLFEYRMVKP
jgi:hypothetical protein